MQNKVNQNKEFCIPWMYSFSQWSVCLMHKPRSINELLAIGGKRLSDLKARNLARTLAIEHVRAALPAKLAVTVVSAGIEQGRLTIGVSSAVWAARLRYVTDDLRLAVGASMSIPVQTVRIKVVPPQA